VNSGSYNGYIYPFTEVLLKAGSTSFPHHEAAGLMKPLRCKGFKAFRHVRNAHLPRICPFQRDFFVNL
ncbi:hypothetical protein D7X33_19560, partial [Butyricicoccus sp. 1XD8-22]